MNVTNKLKVLRQLSSRLATIMFRGTPCTYKVHGSPDREINTGFRVL